MKQFKILGVMVLIVALTGGCSSKYLQETDRVDATAAFQLVDREQFETIDLAQLIVSAAKATNPEATDSLCQAPAQEEGNMSTQGNASSRNRSSIEEALAYFQCVTKDMVTTREGEAKVRLARNSIQERILAASTQSCNAFESNLQRTSARHNFFSGLLSTAAGTAGGLVTAADGARILSGISGVASGYRAEFNQDYMSNLAAYVIIDGIDKRRRDVYAQIQSRGQAKCMTEYPLMAAVRDALYYHGQCSVIAGFQEADDAIKYVADPGMDASLRALSKINLAKELTATPPPADPAKIIARLEEINKKFPATPRNLAGSLLGNDVKQVDILNQAKKVAEESLFGLVKKEEAFGQQRLAWEKTLGLNDTPPIIWGYDEMVQSCAKARAKIEKISSAKQAEDPACASPTPDEQCQTADRLAELTRRVAEVFSILIDNRLATMKEAFAAAQDKDPAKRAAGLAKFTAALQGPVDLQGTISEAMKEIELLTK